MESSGKQSEEVVARAGNLSAEGAWELSQWVCRSTEVDWVCWKGGTLLGGCRDTCAWAGEVGGHVPRRVDHGCSVGIFMLYRAGACQKWLLLPLELCDVWK